MMHWHGKIELDNLNSERHFKPDKIFSNTNLANLLFAFELSRKLRSEGFINVTVNAVHSGEVQNRILTHIPFQGFKAIETGIILLIDQGAAVFFLPLSCPSGPRNSSVGRPFVCHLPKFSYI